MNTHIEGARVNRMVRLAAQVVIVLGLVAGPLTAATPAASARDSEFASAIALAQTQMAQLVESGAVDSISASITDANGLIWAGADGAIDEAGTQASVDTRYGIGSVSKVFAATSIMQLVEEGKIGLDEPVVKYLPQFRMQSPQYRQITVRMLLNHTAGLPGSDYANAFTTKPFPGYGDQALKALSKSSLKTTPGAIAVYCNDCFTLAGEVVASVSGMPYTKYVERNILAPLGMTNSMYITDKMPAQGTVARTFHEGRVSPQEVTNLFATGGLLSTPTDMAAFARAFLGNGTSGNVQLLTPTSVAAMGTDQTQSTLLADKNLVLQYGLGWDNVRDPLFASRGVRVLQKNGATGDYHSNFLVAPEAGIAVFVNAAGRQTGIDGAVGNLGTKIMEQALVDEGALTNIPTSQVTQPAESSPSVDDINSMLGIYVASSGGNYRVTQGDDNSLKLDVLVSGEWNPLSTLTYRTDGAWWAPSPSHSSFRSKTGWGRAYLTQQIHLGGDTPAVQYPLAQRVSPGKPLSKEWRDRMGEWILVNERPDSMYWRQSWPTTELTAIPGLPGYIDIGGTVLDASGRVATMFAQVPQNNGRDQNNLVPVSNGMLRSGTSVLQSLESAQPLPTGTTTVVIGAQGYAQLFLIDKKSRLDIKGASHWKLFNPENALPITGGRSATSTTAPSGSVLVLFGSPGQEIVIRNNS